MILPYIITIFCIGSLINNRAEKDSKISFSQAIINLIIGFAAHLFASHLISFITQDFSFSSNLIFILFLISSIIFFKKIKIPHLDLIEIASLVISLLLGISMGLRDINFGNPDNFHIPLTASVAENTLYPPIFPSTSDLSMSSYHYGVELIGVIFKSLMQLSIWDAHSFQIFFGATLCFLSIYALAKYFIKDSLLALLTSIIATLFTSINSLDFLIRELSHIGSSGFLKQWLLMSWTSVSHMTSQLRLPSQSSAFFFAFALFYLLIESFSGRSKKNIPIMLTAFGLYFTFPAFFYPIAAAAGLFYLWDIYKSKDFVFGLVIMISLAAGKLLTFTGAFADAEGVKALVLAPDLTWLHWGKAYIRYFYDASYLSKLSVAFDYAHPAYHPQIPLFSSITFREFGFSAIFGGVFIIWQISKKKLDHFSILYFAAFISMLPPFIIDFIPRPIETTRFLHLSKIVFVLFLCMQVVKWLSEMKINKMIKLTSLALALIICIPGFISVLPIKAFIFNGNNKVPEKQKALIAAIAKYQQTGDICLETIDFKHGHNISELAGFYGVGGQMYKQDKMTRKTAMQTLNPQLLKELKVNYVLISKDDDLTDSAKANLKDRNLFESLDLGITDYSFYKFKPQAISPAKQDYNWVLGCNIGKGFNPIQGPGGKVFAAQAKQDLLKIKKDLRAQVAKANIPCAFWLKEQAVMNSSLRGMK